MSLVVHFFGPGLGGERKLSTVGARTVVIHDRALRASKTANSAGSFDKADAGHALAKVRWDSRYQKRDGNQERIEFDVTYLLHFEQDEPKIFAYITGDEERVLKEHGVVAGR